MKRRVVGLLAALILASGLQMSAGAEDLTNDYILGNSSLNLLNGGVFSEEDLNIEDYTGGASYSSINVFTDHIYYVADDTKIVQVDRSSGESTVLYQAEAVISRMFVVNDKTAYEVSAYAMSDLSKEQQNIVNRAEEQAKVTWTPLKNVSGWDGDYTFRA